MISWQSVNLSWTIFYLVFVLFYSVLFSSSPFQEINYFCSYLFYSILFLFSICFRLWDLRSVQFISGASHESVPFCSIPPVVCCFYSVSLNVVPVCPAEGRASGSSELPPLSDLDNPPSIWSRTRSPRPRNEPESRSGRGH